jgi:FixJ family two-component response regulator
MIENEHQYRVTKREIQRFEEAIAAHEGEAAADTRTAPVLLAAVGDGLRSQLDSLRREVDEYEALRASASELPDLTAIERLPDMLIRGRIAAGLTHKQLAARLGIKEQQVQRYEATRYASASHRRMKELARAINQTIQP